MPTMRRTTGRTPRPGPSGFASLLLWVAAFAALPPAAAGQEPAQAGEYEKGTRGTRLLVGAGGLEIKMLVEASNLGGGEVELGEITFPVGSGADRRGHTHGRVEIFYVLSGTLDHIVNDVSHVLEPGRVGIVRPGDRVVHRVVGDEPVRALVIWAPGGEAERIAGFLEERPLPPDPDP